jgi:hypothetical protein
MSVAECPVGDASVGGLAPAPPLWAVSVLALWWFVTPVPAIVVIVAFPCLGNALVIVASEFLSSANDVFVLTYFGIFVRIVMAIVVPIAFEPFWYASPSVVALELPGIAWSSLTTIFIRIVPAIVRSIANLECPCAVVVFALELSGPADTFWTGGGLVTPITTVLLTIALPENGNATVITTATTPLTFGAIGNTCLVISLHYEIVWAHAIEPSPWGYQTEMGTSPIVSPTGIGHLWLSCWVHHLEVIGKLNGLLEHFLVLPRVFVGAKDFLEVPVSPVYPIIEDDDGEDVGALQYRDMVSVLSIQVRVSQLVQMGITPEHLFRVIIDGDCIWPSEVFCHDLRELRTVHPYSPDVRGEGPFSEETVPFLGETGNGTWLSEPPS